MEHKWVSHKWGLNDQANNSGPRPGQIAQPAVAPTQVIPPTPAKTSRFQSTSSLLFPLCLLLTTGTVLAASSQYVSLSEITNTYLSMIKTDAKPPVAQPDEVRYLLRQLTGHPVLDVQWYFKSPDPKVEKPVAGNISIHFEDVAAVSPNSACDDCFKEWIVCTNADSQEKTFPYGAYTLTAQKVNGQYVFEFANHRIVFTEHMQQLMIDQYSFNAKNNTMHIHVGNPNRPVHISGHGHFKVS